MPRKLQKVIKTIYWGKIKADRVDDAEGNARQSLAEFVVDFFYNQYGLRSLAEKYLIEFIMSLKKWSPSVLKASLFSRFCGLLDCLSQDDLDLCMYFLSCCPAGQRETPKNSREYAPGKVRIEVWRVMEAIKISMWHFGSKVPDRLLRRVHQLDQRGIVFGSNTVDEDEVFLLVLDEYHTVQKEKRMQFRSLLASVDADGDGIITIDEFEGIIDQIDGGKSKVHATRMFREVVESSEVGEVTADALSEVALKKGMLLPSITALAMNRNLEGDLSASMDAASFNLLIATWEQAKDELASQLSKITRATEANSAKGLENLSNEIGMEDVERLNAILSIFSDHVVDRLAFEESLAVGTRPPTEEAKTRGGNSEAGQDRLMPDGLDTDSLWKQYRDMRKEFAVIHNKLFPRLISSARAIAKLVRMTH